LRQIIATSDPTDVHVNYDTQVGEAFVGITEAVDKEGYD